MAASPRFIALIFLAVSVALLSGCGAALNSMPLAETQPSPAHGATAKPELQFTISPSTGEPGTLITLEWHARNATKVELAGLGSFDPDGRFTVVAQDSMTFAATATGDGGVTTQNVVFNLTRPRRPPRDPRPPNPINHIIMMFQENRSFDNYFSNLNNYRVARGLPADVDVADPNATNPTFDFTGTISRFHMVSMCHENTSPAWNEAHVQVDTDYQFKAADQVTTSRMNGFVYTGAKYARDNGFLDTEGRRAMGYYTEADLPYYYFMATTFALSDRWFSPALTQSAPNRVYTYAATSNGYVYDPQMAGVRNIFQLLQENGISWKVYYTDTKNGIPSAYITYFDAFYQAHKDRVVPVSQFTTDAQNGSLPAVAIIESGYNSGLDEHPSNNVQAGAAYVASLINTLMNSQSWKDSAFFLTYDEAGGLYDHVPPPTAVSPDGIAPVDRNSTDIQGDFTRYGMRVPNLVVSPYVKPGYVSHTVIDHTAILKFIETRFNLPPLNQRDGAQADMYDFFDFSAPPRLNPPTPPAQPTSGPCYFNRLP